MTCAFPISSNSSSASAPRQFATRLATSANFSESRAGQVALIVSELATNLARHAGGGQILLQTVTAGDASGVEVFAIDKGPGMRRLPEELTDGYSTAGSLGTGLGAIQRQSDDFEIFTQPGAGTAALARVWADTRRARPEPSPFGSVSVPKSGQSVCGDGWQVRYGSGQYVVMVADGLGHGPQAADAAAEASRIFKDCFALPPADLIDELHRGLRATRGAAVAIASLDRDRQVVRFAGVGNIGASLVSPDLRRHNLASHNGTAGVAVRRVQEFTYPMTPGTSLVMHSDGLTTHWSPQLYPALWARPPALVAAVLYRDFTRGRDDSTVLVARFGA